MDFPHLHQGLAQGKERACRALRGNESFEPHRLFLEEPAAGFGEHLVAGPCGGDAAVADHKNVGDAGDHLLRALGHEDNLLPLGHQPRDGRGQGAPARHVEACEGIVQDEQLRAGEECPGDQELSDLTVGESPEPLAKQGSDPQALDDPLDASGISVVLSEELARRECSAPAAERAGFVAPLFPCQDLLLKFERDVADPLALCQRVVADEPPPDARDIAAHGAGERRFPGAIGA